MAALLYVTVLPSTKKSEVDVWLTCRLLFYRSNETAIKLHLQNENDINCKLLLALAVNNIHAQNKHRQ